MAAPYDLHFVQGATFERVFTWRVDGVVQSLAGKTIHSEIRTKEDSNSPRIVDLAEYMTVIDDEIHLRVPAPVTAAFDPRKFKRAAWDLFLIETADPTQADCILQGAAEVDPSATRWTSP